MQTILDKACQTLAGENNAASGCSYNNEISAVGPPPENFLSFQDLNIYGDQHEQEIFRNEAMGRSSSTIDAFNMPNTTAMISAGGMPPGRSSPFG